MQSGVKDGKVALYAGYLRFDAADYKGTVDALTIAEVAGEKEDDVYLKRGKSAFQLKDYAGTIADLEKIVQKGKLIFRRMKLWRFLTWRVRKKKKHCLISKKAASMDSKTKMSTIN